MTYAIGFYPPPGKPSICDWKPKLTIRKQWNPFSSTKFPKVKKRERDEEEEIFIFSWKKGVTDCFKRV